MKEPRAGRVRLDPTAFVAPGAVVIGEVSLGPRASVWFNTVVRGDVAEIGIGEASNVQDNSTVHVDEGKPARIGSRVTVGHRSIVHGCVIEDDCLIGMGSVLLSGCRIGAGSMLGAASLVLEGTQIPPGSLVLGSPARVVGPVADPHRAAIRHGASTYADLARSCMRRGYARAASRSGELARDRGEMTWSEWQERLKSMAELPARVESDTRGLDPAAWRRRDAIDIVLVLRGNDRDVRRPCLEALRSAEETRLPSLVPVTADHRTSPEQALAEWREQREALVSALVEVPPSDWGRIAGHATRGPFTLAELVREWVDEDVERHAALAIALRAGA